jgi:DNA-directed RNA polymerase specialized sigma24 family protein
MIDEDTIVQALADGLSLAQTADRFGVSIDDVRKARSQAVAAFSDGEALRQEWALESKRLAACGMRFYQIAMRDNDTQAAMIFLKASERRATLCGANAPQGHSVHIMHQTATEQKKTSTEKIRDVLDIILHITPRERELIDKREVENDQSTEIPREINELREKRNLGPLGEDEWA